jgi:hypothetical protein
MDRHTLSAADAATSEIHRKWHDAYAKPPGRRPLATIACREKDSSGLASAGVCQSSARPKADRLADA